ncbi:class I SAM-dependent methyltransferase [Pedobacter metabolipauper]|uniref:Methyltransferase family protein n=1 Tax=Pedobacter metabolipauper TaxID=425513 RepID=A0A4V3D1B2_9SPHI|nr:class I SAM-dependent methyltransferase [Pedobacter metabolipauper]TDQ09897.1 methyltransferase family protein [Pedobacter metabolipauper]
MQHIAIKEKHKCNLCGGFVIKLPEILFKERANGPFAYRCISCRSTFIHWALAEVFASLHLPKNPVIYELSSHGAFYNYLKRNFDHLTTSDYMDGITSGTMYKGRTMQNVEHLTYFSDTFDVVTSTEVFEHVINDHQGFTEVLRVLKPGGIFCFTVPLDLKSGQTTERAYVDDSGQIVHILEPEYHGDYMKNGILAFRNYGTDILDKLKAAGFSTAEIFVVANKFNFSKEVIVCRK